MSIPNELINNHENKETYNYILKKSIPNNYSFDINDNSSENGVPVLDDSFSNESNGKNIWTFIDNEKEYEEENNIKNFQIPIHIYLCTKNQEIILIH